MKEENSQMVFFHYHYGMIKLQNYANFGDYFKAYFY